MGFSLQWFLLWTTGSIVGVLRLSCPVACGIFPDQGSTALAGWFSTTLSHQGSLWFYFWRKESAAVVKTVLPVQGAWVWPLVFELRSHMPFGVAKKFKNENTKKNYFKKKVLLYDYLMKAKYSKMSSLASTEPLQTLLCISPRADGGKHWPTERVSNFTRSNSWPQSQDRGQVWPQSPGCTPGPPPSKLALQLQPPRTDTSFIMAPKLKRKSCRRRTQQEDFKS